MTKKERREYILNLNEVVKRWRENSRLFYGGCCFCAGQVAKLLEKKNIRYQVVCWQVGYGAMTLKEIIEENSCSHLAIQVSLDGKKFIIGGDFYSYHANYISIHKRIRSNEIIKCDLLGHKLDRWNHIYNRKLNNRFINILTKSVEK
jgi:hypothetical protein